MEFYFGQTNYHKDDFLKNQAGKDGWIELSIIFAFPKMRRFHDHIYLEELYETMSLSSLVDVGTADPFGDGNIVYYIRKKALKMKSEYRNIFRKEEEG